MTGDQHVHTELDHCLDCGIGFTHEEVSGQTQVVETRKETSKTL
jgi:hypothetical protein